MTPWQPHSEWGNMENMAVAVPLLYLLSFLLQAFTGKALGKAGAWVSLGLSGLATGLACTLIFQVEKGTLASPAYTWVSISGFELNAGILLNSLAANMLAIVAFVTFLVHLYSMEYMKNDPRKSRYFAYLGLFAFSMCGVVLASNLFFIFIFWELVGFCSYLLIGFWFEKKIAAKASQKAFVLNRIGDLGFVLAMMLMVAHGLSLDLQMFPGLIESPATMNLIGFSLTLGVLGKSAQFPLQVWLPDAMAGPTPASSLIHAATMVAAGVYLLLRCGFLFQPEALHLLSLIGATTAVLAALSALKQTDIKAVLAYSTISQLGFMVMGVGLGAFDYAFFHLMTHAFFKAGLFLVAGAIIHQLHQAQQGSDQHFDAQDLRQMGALRKKMPLTFICYAIFAASLAGLPLFSGFLSKDGILMAAFEQANLQGGWLWLIAGAGVLASGLTALYIGRHAFLIFFGAPRMEAKTFAQVRKANWKMAVPLIALAICSTWLLYSPLNPLHAAAQWGNLPHKVPHQLAEWPFLVGFTLLALAGLALAWWMFRRGKLLAETRGTQLIEQHFYLDKVYEKGIARSVLAFAGALAWFDKRIVDGAVNGVANLMVRKDEGPSVARLADWFDRKVVDRLVNGVAQLVMGFGGLARKLQTGNLQKYLIYTVLGLLLLLWALIYFTRNNA